MTLCCCSASNQATSYLCAAWEALAAREDVPMQSLAVAFEGVRIVQAVPATPDEDVSLRVLLDHSGRFQARWACFACMQMKPSCMHAHILLVQSQSQSCMHVLG